MRLSSFLTGAILGGLFGAAAALLYTPESGPNLRTQAKDYVTHLKEEVQHAARSKRVEMEAELEHMRAPHTPEQA